jgi:hypothetical protein
MAKCMNDVVLQSTCMAMQNAQFIAVNCDKITIIDYQNWVSMHVFMVEGWKRSQSYYVYSKL